MKKQNLVLYAAGDNLFHTIIKTKHGRVIYLKVSKNAEKFTVEECYYLDRMRGGKYYATPQKFIKIEFFENEILEVISTQLDRSYYGLEYNNNYSELSTDKFIATKQVELRRGYKFLIFVADGKNIGGMPEHIQTRFKNKIHREIFLEMEHHSGSGVITNCHYCDRNYKERSVVIPETLSTVYFSYNRQTILNIVNNELNGEFTDIIFVTDGSIDLKNKVPLCGNI